MKLMIVPVTPFQQNCSILVDETTGQAVAIDPGGDLDRIDEALKTAGGKLEKVLLTHGHIDHCGQAAEFARRHGVKIEGPHIDDKFWIDQLPAQGQRFGMPPLEAFESDRWLNDGDTVHFGNIDLTVAHCPGHTPGHVVFSSPRPGWQWSATCSFRARSGEPTFRAAITSSCSTRSSSACGRWATTSLSCLGMGRCRPSAMSERAIRS